MIALPLPRPHSFTVCCVPNSDGRSISQLIVKLVLQGPVTILDFGSRFPPRRLQKILAQHTPDPISAAGRISFHDARSSYDMLAVLEALPALPRPCLLIDPLSTFHDDRLPLSSAVCLLDACLRQLDHLRLVTPILAVVFSPHTPEHACLVERICGRADHLVTTVQPALLKHQPALL
jgi:hypothetical protein